MATMELTGILKDGLTPSFSFYMRGGGNMANAENLKLNSERTPKERQELARKAGIASGEARRKKKTIKEAAEAIFSANLTDEEIEKYKAKGYEVETLLDAVIVGQVQSARKGNSQAFANFMRLFGEGVETVDVNIDKDYVDAVETVEQLMKEKKE